MVIINNYGKEFLVTGTEGSVKGVIDIKFHEYRPTPFAAIQSLLGAHDKDSRMGVKISGFVGGIPFQTQYINDYTAGGSQNNETMLLHEVDNLEASMRRHMEWIANGGQKAFDEKMISRGFSLFVTTGDADLMKGTFKS